MKALRYAFGSAAVAVSALTAWAPRPAAAESASPHPVVTRLVGVGFETGLGEPVQLTPPLLSPGMSPEQQRAAIERLVGKSRVDRFLSDRIVAPHKVVVGTERKLAAGAIRRLDQYYVAHGAVSVIRDENLMKEIMGEEPPQSDNGRQGPGFEQYVESRGGVERDRNQTGLSQPTVSRYRVPLLDKVVVSGLIRNRSYSEDGLLVESAVSATDLLGDADDPTVWQAIPRGVKTDDGLAPPEPYRGLAAYLQVTRLDFLPDAVLVECHAVLVEPRGWFGGKNLLASKLPIVVQSNVRKFRRRLANYREKQATQAASE